MILGRRRLVVRTAAAAAAAAAVAAHTAHVAALVGADLLIILSGIQGLMTKSDGTGDLIPSVRKIDDSVRALAGGAGSERNVGGMVTKLLAAEIAAEGGVDTIIASGRREKVLLELADGRLVAGTYEDGLYLRDAQGWWHLGAADGLPAETVFFLAEHAGALVASHPNGVYRLALAQLARERVGAIRVDIGRRHRGAVRREPGGDRGAQAAGADDERAPA